MSLRTRLLATADRVRGIAGRLDMRQHDVFVVERTWSGERAGLGVFEDRETPIRVMSGCEAARVTEMTSRDIIASGGIYTAQDIKVGPVTPDHMAIGVNESTIDPEVSDEPKEIMFRVTGPGMGPSGRWFKRIHDDTVKNFSRFLYLRAVGTSPGVSQL